MSKTFIPSYIELYESGKLKERLEQLEGLLESCKVCPRNCGVNRLKEFSGFCRAGYDPYISSICDHHGEEPVLSGSNGSGTIFFGSCNLRCVFCQNHDISQNQNFFTRHVMDIKELARQMIILQNDKKVHNINFVSPSHFAPQMVRAIYEAIPLGLQIPIIYNSNAYDSLSTLKLLDGIIDIYLPDYKYSDDTAAQKYSQAKSYNKYAKEAIKEMYRQTGNLQVDKNGVAQRGLIVRHLILPNDLAGTKEALSWLAKELSPKVTISLMAQYYPCHKALQIPLLSGTITGKEYWNALNIMKKLNLTNGFTQEMDAPEYYLPDFDRDGHPFEDRIDG